MIHKCKLYSLAFFICAFFIVGCDESQSQSAGENESKTEKEVLYDKALELVRFPETIRKSINRIIISKRLEATKTETISFENSLVDGYLNEKCLDESCKVFSKDTNPTQYKKPSEHLFDHAFEEEHNYGQWIFTGDICVSDIGTGDENCDQDSTHNEELIAILPWVKKEYCEAISYGYGSRPQYKYNITNGTLELHPKKLTKFIGRHNEGKKIPQEFEGKSDGKYQAFGCYSLTQENGQKSYHFYNVLLAR